MIKTYRVNIQHAMSETMMEWIVEEKPPTVMFRTSSPSHDYPKRIEYMVDIRDKQTQFFFELTFKDLIIGSALVPDDTIDLVKFLTKSKT